MDQVLITPALLEFRNTGSPLKEKIPMCKDIELFLKPVAQKDEM